MAETPVPNPEAKAYVEVVESAQLRAIRLIESEFKMLPEVLLPEQEGWKYGYTCDVGQTVFNEDNGVLTAWVHTTAYCRSGRRKILNLKCKYLLAYSVEGRPDAQTVERFTHAVGPYSIYPYFRAHFAEMASQGGVKAPPLPIMKGLRRRIADWVDTDAQSVNDAKG